MRPIPEEDEKIQEGFDLNDGSHQQNSNNRGMIGGDFNNGRISDSKKTASFQNKDGVFYENAGKGA